MDKLTNYAKSALAFITGDKDAKTALRNERMAFSALDGQLASLKGQKVRAEVGVETAEENYKKAVLNIKGDTQYPIEDAETFIQSVASAQKTLDNAKEVLSDVEESITYWTALQNNTAYFGK